MRSATDRTAVSPFAALPASLAAELLDAADTLATDLAAPLDMVHEARDDIRHRLTDTGRIVTLDTGGVRDAGSCCAVAPGTALTPAGLRDLAAAAAFAVEGIPPGGQDPRWPEPRHRSIVIAVPPDPSTNRLTSALACAMSVELAAEAPHDLAFAATGIDGIVRALFTGIRSAAVSKSSPASREFLNRLKPALTAYGRCFAGGNGTPPLVGIPRDTRPAEIAGLEDLPGDIPGSALFTLLLDPGESISPAPLDPGDLERAAAVPISDAAFIRLRDRIVASVAEYRVMYVRPWPWTPALRIEVPGALADDNTRMAALLGTVAAQCDAPGISRPYPVWLAERTAASFRDALPELVPDLAARIAGHASGGNDPDLSMFLFTDDVRRPCDV